MIQVCQNPKTGPKCEHIKQTLLQTQCSEPNKKDNAQKLKIRETRCHTKNLQH